MRGAPPCHERQRARRSPSERQASVGKSRRRATTLVGWRPEDASEEDDSDTDKPEGMLDQENLVGREAKRQRHVLSNRRYMERVVNVSHIARFMEQYVIVTPTAEQVEATIVAATADCVSRAIASALEVVEAEERDADAAAERERRRRIGRPDVQAASMGTYLLAIRK